MGPMAKTSQNLDFFKVIFDFVPWRITIKPPFGRIYLALFPSILSKSKKRKVSSSNHHFPGANLLLVSGIIKTSPNETGEPTPLTTRMSQEFRINGDRINGL